MSESAQSCGSKNVGQLERLVSFFGGALLVTQALKKRNAFSIIQGGLGGALIYRGLSGKCEVYRALKINTNVSLDDAPGIKVEKSVIVARPANVLFSYWRNFSNLPSFMDHLISVDVSSDLLSTWTVKSPIGAPVKWDAEIINEIANELIAWRSIPGSQIPNVGSVRFHAYGTDETKVSVSLQYHPPAGEIGAGIAQLLGSDPTVQIEESLKRFKSKMEAGHLTEAAPSKPLPTL